MRKLILFLSLVLFAVYCDAQQKYKCEYVDSTTSVVPDSTFRYLALKNNLSSKAIEHFLEHQRANPPHRYQLRIARAEQGRTIITLDKGSIQGNLTMQTFGSSSLEAVDSLLYKDFDSLLYHNDEIFNAAPTATGFSDTAWYRGKRAYRGTGKKLSILGYECDEYVSNDLTCYIWVTGELPEYINPGIRTNNVRGVAVLGFKYSQAGTTTKSILKKLEKVL